MLKPFTLFMVPFLALAHSVTANAKPPVEVIAYQVTQTTQPQVIQALGNLEAKQSIDISANVTETIQAIHFTEGQAVRKSQLLLELNSNEELALLEEAKALAEEAQRQYRRVKDVEGRGSVTRSLIDEKYREWQTAVAKRKVIEAQVADRRIYAPFAGQLGLSRYAVGALVTPGSKIVSLDDTSEMKLDLYIPVKFLSYLKQGQTVTLNTRAFPNRSFTGHISAISPRLEQDVRMVQVRALIENPDNLLKTNMMVEANIDLPPKTQLMAPNTAILMLGDNEFVYRLKPGKDGLYKAEKVAVETGEIGNALTEVVSGLNENDLVVSQGVMRVNTKVPVKIKAMQNDTTQEKLLQPDKPTTKQGQ